MLEALLEFFVALNLSHPMGWVLSFCIMAMVILGISWFADYISRRYLVRLLDLMLTKAKPKWGEMLKKHKVIRKFAHIAPAVIIYSSAPLFLFDDVAISTVLVRVIQTIVTVYIILTTVYGLNAILLSVEDIYNSYPISRKRPIKSYLQVVKTILIFFTVIIVISIILDKSPWAFFTGLGAATAVIMLVFRDSILGFVASIQLASYDMIRIGDWIFMPSFGADGDVMEISLTTVKVRNFDKTIVTIPTYALLTNGVKNWRGMQESGGRRIKRSIKIDLKTIRFCEDEFLHKLSKVSALKPYLAATLPDIRQSKDQSEDSSVPLNGRHLTNVGLFRNYIENFLKANDMIHKENFTFLVRQLEPKETGLPIELYVFTKTTKWKEYEKIQADIFDHLLASLPIFELQAFQYDSASKLS
ncbi:MAG: mechanosensitive ion channel family protein [Oligoflexales bacterium]